MRLNKALLCSVARREALLRVEGIYQVFNLYNRKTRSDASSELVIQSLLYLTTRSEV